MIRRWLASALVAGAALCSLSAEAEEPDIVVVHPLDASTSARPVVEYLRAQLPEAKVRTTTATPEARRWLSNRDDTSLYIVLDPSSGEVSVVRPETGTIVTRWLGERAHREEPYAVALAAGELIEIARNRRVGASGELERPPGPPRWSFMIAAGGAVTAGLGSEPALLQPSAGLWVLRRGERRRGWFDVGVEGRFLGGASRDLTADGEQFVLDYRRNDLLLRSGGGLSIGPVDLGLSGLAGMSFTSVDAQSVLTDEASSEAQLVWFGGLAAEAGYEMFRGVGLRLALEGLFVPRPVRYFVRDEVAIEEGAFRTVVSLFLVWQSDHVR